MTRETGLTSAEVERLTSQGKANVTPDKSSLSTAAIIAGNVFTYFNAIFAGLTVLVALSGNLKNLTFLPVVIINTIIGIVQQLQAKKVLDDLALLDVSSYTAIRDGQDVTVPSDQLVQGDFLRLESGQQIPADAVVVRGDASANESLLTGEEDEIQKAPGSELKSGSFLVAGSVVAELTKVGAESYAAKLTAEAKQSKEKPSVMVRDIERVVRTAGILIIPIGAMMFYQSTVIKGDTYQHAVSSMVSAVTGMIPEGLYLLVTISLALSAARLARRKVLLHDMHSVEALARVDVLCVDKTGTITSEDMSVQEVFGPEGQTPEGLDAATEVLASYIRTVPDKNITMEALRDHFDDATPLEAQDVMAFSSKDKYSQVVTDAKTYRLGAPDFLLDERELARNDEALRLRTGQGMRVLSLVEVTDVGACPLLFVALRNQVREGARQTFEGFASRGVAIRVISGDNPLTVSRVAEQAGIIDADKYVDATTLDTQEKVQEAVREYVVFGRVKPEQKRQFVRALQADGLRVAMTGDGVNDILAMKEAECSIAMGGGSDAARQAAQVVLLDSEFAHMNNIVSEGRRNINNITRSATLFLYKNVFSLILALFSIFGSFAYPLTPAQVSLISAFNIGIPAFFLALEPNEEKQGGRFISTVLRRSLPASFTSFFAIVAMMLFANLFEISSDDVATASTYLLSLVGYLILLSLCQPLNRYRALIIVGSILGLALTATFLWNVFDIRALSPRALVLCVVFGLAEISVMQMLGFALDRIRERIPKRALRALHAVQ